MTAPRRPSLACAFARLGPLGALALMSLAAEAAGAAGTLHLDRCAGQCTYIPGPNSACQNRSSLLTGANRTLSPFEHGDAAWELLVACVESVLDPYDITVTTTDPGCGVPHWEVAVAGTPDQFGLPEQVGGIAPFNCGVIPNASAFAFANSYGDMLQLCGTVVHEFAHLLGADHELAQRDPMYYIDTSGCLVQRFAAADEECGEGTPRTCCTGAPTQSSDAILRSVLGQRPGGLVFPDSFEAWDTFTETGSTCHWDEVIGGEPPLKGDLPASAPLACGTVLLTDER